MTRSGLLRRLAAILLVCLAPLVAAHAGGLEDGPPPAAGTEPVYPAEIWLTASPAEMGMDAERLREARDYALAGGGAGMVVRSGRLVHSWGDLSELHDLKSTTKSIGVTALGLAIADRRLSLSDPAVAILPGFGVPPAENAETGWLDDVTLLHLATHSAGFDKVGDFNALLFEPGTAWSYSDAGPNWLADLLTFEFGVDLHEVLGTRVFAPIGIRPDELEWRDHTYRPDLLEGIKRREFGSGIEASVDAMARIGYLYLRRGEWAGQRIVPHTFVDEVSRPAPALAGLPMRDPAEHENATAHYGLLWWNNGDSRLPGVPADAYWGWGMRDSLIVVIPSLDLVIARAGEGWRAGWDADYAVLGPFLTPIAESATESARGTAPYPPSTAILGIAWAPAGTIARAAEGSDNWPVTWGDDGALYTAFGDGWGFEEPTGDKLSLGYAKVTGPPDAFTGIDIPSETGEQQGFGPTGRKASGMLMVDGVLYQWVRNANGDGEQCQLARSPDRAVTWEWSPWTFADFGYCAFLNFGRNYEGARDSFVYMYTPDTPGAYEAADAAVLARAPKDRIFEREAYEFLAGLDANGEPTWSADVGGRRPVFEFPDAVNRLDVTYNAPLGRYLLTLRSQQKHGGVEQFSLFEAPEPWGPWATVFLAVAEDGASAGDVDWGESQHIPSKWISEDGREIHLVFSGDDSFSVRRATLTVASDDTASAPSGTLVRPANQRQDLAAGVAL